MRRQIVLVIGDTLRERLLATAAIRPVRCVAGGALFSKDMREA
jgi:hypothetical protein